MKQMTLPYQIHIGKPPRAIRKAKLDNIALVPASLLFQKGKYQIFANNLLLYYGVVSALLSQTPLHFIYYCSAAKVLLTA